MENGTEDVARMRGLDAAARAYRAGRESRDDEVNAMRAVLEAREKSRVAVLLLASVLGVLAGWVVRTILGP